MLVVTPPRRLQIVRVCLALVAALGLTGLGALQLANAEISPLLVLWIGLPLVGLPLAVWSGYQLYGLLTASYRLDRNGFQLRWGLNREQAPLADIERLERPGAALVSPPPLPRLLGMLVGERRSAGNVWRYYACAGGQLVTLVLGSTRLVVSPPDPEAFERAFIASTRLGSLQPMARRSVRPDLLPARLWADGWARLLLIAGILLPLILLGYLGVQAGRLPPAIPFGFTAEGAPAAAAPPGRLLLLPLIGGLVWLADLLLGAWLYRRPSDRPLAYILWGLAIVIGALLAGASLLLIRMA